MNKKLLTIGTLGAVLVPIASIVSCGNGSSDKAKKHITNPTTNPTTNNPTHVNNNVPITTASGKKTIDRSGVGTWSNVPSYTVILGDGKNVMANTKITTMSLFETKIFKYYVDMSAYIDHDVKISKVMFEKFVRKFESNVNYGIGAYFTSAKFVGKPAIEFLAGSGGVSWGGESGTEITLSKANPAVGTSYVGDAWVNTIAYLALHEYGHHETLTSSRLFKGATQGQLDAMKIYLDANGLSKFTAHWGDTGTVGGKDFANTTKDYQTPFGVIKSGSSVYAKPGYNWHASEFVTRVEAAFESNFASSTYVNVQKGWAGSGDIGGMARAFNGSTVFEKLYINSLIEAYKQKVYGFDTATKDDSVAVGVAIDPNNIPDSKEFSFSFVSANYGIKNVKSSLRTLFGSISDTWSATDDIKAYYTTHKSAFTFKVPVNSYPVEYRFNTDFTNQNVEEVVNGSALILDNSNDVLNKKIEALHEIKRWGMLTTTTKLIKGTKTITLKQF